MLSNPAAAHVCNRAIGPELITARPFHRRGVRIASKHERRRERGVTEAEEQQLLDACKLLNEPARAAAGPLRDEQSAIPAWAAALAFAGFELPH